MAYMYDGRRHVLRATRQPNLSRKAYFPREHIGHLRYGLRRLLRRGRGGSRFLVAQVAAAEAAYCCCCSVLWREEGESLCPLFLVNEDGGL